MKKLFYLSIVGVSAVGLAMAGCGRNKVQADATQPLAQSFATAEPEVQKAIEVVNTSLKAGNYVEATRALAPVVEQRVLTAPQKEAVGIALQQMNQAIAADPSLDTKEMYEMRAKMFQATRRGSRF
jgi:hypothetical protein